MFEATQDGLGRNAPVHSIHGSLLAVGELLRFVMMVLAAVIGCNLYGRLILWLSRLV